jgi:hypothetical protein
MGRRNYTKGRKAKTVITALALATIGALAGVAIVLAGGNAQAATTDTPQLCLSGEQHVELAIPIRVSNTPICLPISEDRTEGSRVDPNYSRAATVALSEGANLIEAVDASEAVVVCWSSGDWAAIAEWFEAQGNDRIRGAYGFVHMPSNVINISPVNCRALDEIVYGGERPEKMVAANALGVLIHEALHTTGMTDESAAECYAMQLTETAAVELGLGHEYGASLAGLFLEFNETYREGSMYDSPECRDGGGFDLNNQTLWQ